MFDLRQELLNVVRALGAAEVPYALCGGLAVVLHGYPRATRDIDLIVQADDIDSAHQAVRSLGYTLPAKPMTLQQGKENEQEIHRISRIEGEEVITIDFLLLSDFLQDVWKARRNFEIDGEPITAVSRAGLAKMKRSAGRPQDLADLEKLEADESD